MKFVNIQGPFSEKWLALCEEVYNILYYNHKKAIEEGNKEAEAKIAAALIRQKRIVEEAWKQYNEEIGDGIDWEKVYEEDK